MSSPWDFSQINPQITDSPDTGRIAEFHDNLKILCEKLDYEVSILEYGTQNHPLVSDSDLIFLANSAELPKIRKQLKKLRSHELFGFRLHETPIFLTPDLLPNLETIFDLRNLKTLFDPLGVSHGQSRLTGANLFFHIILWRNYFQKALLQCLRRKSNIRTILKLAKHPLISCQHIANLLGSTPHPSPPCSVREFYADVIDSSDRIKALSNWHGIFCGYLNQMDAALEEFAAPEEGYQPNYPDICSSWVLFTSETKVAKRCPFMATLKVNRVFMHYGHLLIQHLGTDQMWPTGTEHNIAKLEGTFKPTKTFLEAHHLLGRHFLALGDRHAIPTPFNLPFTHGNSSKKMWFQSWLTYYRLLKLLIPFVCESK